MGWVLVQVRELPDGRAEVLIKRDDRFEAMGGVLGPWPGEPRAVYSPDEADAIRAQWGADAARWA